MPCKIITVFLVFGMVSVHCYPINKEGKCSTTDSGSSQVIMSNTVRELLIDVRGTETSKEGLTGVFLSAEYLVKNELYMPEYQCLQRQVCSGLLFINDSVCHESNLTYSQLIDYYNELVLHLRLAEHNLQTAIDLEIKEANRSESLEKERNITRLLNESILPALEFTLNISRTNCSMTTLLADWMISFYSNCVAVQSSNNLLAQISGSLFDILQDDDDPGVILRNDNAAIPTNGHKEWCIFTEHSCYA